MPIWAATAAALFYAALLFAVARVGQPWSLTQAGRRHWPAIYALSLAVYCTSWTFYGAVGTATQSGWLFLPITLGPMLVLLFARPLLERIAAEVRQVDAISISDFLSSRYGKSRSIAALVCLIALFGAVPYLALQLRSVAMTAAALSPDMTAAGNGIEPRSMLLLAAGLAVFTIVFGARRYEATGRNRGLVAALALDSVVKLAALIAVAIFAILTLADASEADVLRASSLLGATFAGTPIGAQFFTILLLSMLAIVCLPRQFYVTFVECRDVSHVGRARTPFLVYLALITLAVLPITLAGVMHLPTQSRADLYVINLPLHFGQSSLAMLVFVGGFAAALGMVVTTSLALATMITHDLIAPLLLRTTLVTTKTDMGRLLLMLRRLSILLIIALASLYALSVSEKQQLASIGLVAFAAMAQFAPALLGSFWWNRGTARGARIGLAVGGALWFYTLFLPSYAGILVLLPTGPLDPQALLGLRGLDPLTHGVLWSLGGNLLVYLLVSVMRAPDTAKWRGGFSRQRFSAVHSSGELMALAARFVGVDAAHVAFEALALQQRRPLIGASPLRQDEAQLSERLIASVIGAPSARAILTSALSGATLKTADVIEMLDTTSHELQISRELLKTTFDSISQGISVVDAQLNLVAWNDRYIELFDYPPGFIRAGLPIADVIRYNALRGECGPGEVDAHVNRRLDHMRQGTAHSFERLRPNGMVLKSMGNPMPGGGHVTTFTDVTAENQAQRALEEANRLLEQRVIERTRALAEEADRNARLAVQLRQANSSKTRFLAAASHDLLQPLHAARLFSGALDMASTQAGRDDMAGMARNIDKSINSAEQLIRTLLDISRLDAAGITPKDAPVQLRGLLRDLATQFEPLATARGLRLGWRCHEALHVMTDRTLLRSVLQNFLSNALRYTREGRVLLTARRRGDMIDLEVRDTGCGIAAADIERIFNEFERLPSAYAADSGAGLGLAIVRRTADLIGARISVRSQPGRGSCFGIVLPLLMGGEASIDQPAMAETAPAGPEGLHILCVDDDPQILSALASLLKTWSCTCLCANTAAAARAAIDAQAFDAALVDFHLGAQSGLEVIGHVLAVQPDCRIALISADTQMLLQGKEGDVTVMHKPLHPQRLRQWLAGITARQSASAPKAPAPAPPAQPGFG